MSLPDRDFSEWITGFAGENSFVDGIAALFATDFFVPVSISLYMSLLWYGTKDPLQRIKNQYGVMCASASMGIACGWISLINNFERFWDRPFVEGENARHAAEELFYLPHDPSFPSNLAAVAFAAATGIFIYNRKASIPVIILALLWSISRVFAGIHYPIDIVGGAAIGIATGVFTYGVFRLLHPVPTFFHGLARKFYLA